jgi:hypothetical protein
MNDNLTYELEAARAMLMLSQNTMSKSAV